MGRLLSINDVDRAGFTDWCDIGYACLLLGKNLHVSWELEFSLSSKTRSTWRVGYSEAVQ